jgi:hypothetical protein
VIFRAIEPGGTEPILQRKIAAVMDAQAALLGRVDEEQPAERPERLAAERCLRFLVEDDDAAARIGKFASRHKAREASPDNDRVRVQVVSPGD